MYAFQYPFYLNTTINKQKSIRINLGGVEDGGVVNVLPLVAYKIGAIGIVHQVFGTFLRNFTGGKGMLERCFAVPKFVCKGVGGWGAKQVAPLLAQWHVAQLVCIGCFAFGQHKQVHLFVAVLIVGHQIIAVSTVNVELLLGVFGEEFVAVDNFSVQYCINCRYKNLASPLV